MEHFIIYRNGSIGVDHFYDKERKDYVYTAYWQNAIKDGNTTRYDGKSERVYLTGVRKSKPSKTELEKAVLKKCGIRPMKIYVNVF